MHVSELVSGQAGVDRRTRAGRMDLRPVSECLIRRMQDAPRGMRRRLCREAGLEEVSLCRYLAGTTAVSRQNWIRVERIGAALGLRPEACWG